MKVLYFGSLRAAIGTGEEEVTPPAEVTTLGALAEWLKTRSPKHESGLGRARLVRGAINQEYAGFDREIAAGDEIAFFPPVTGGGSA